ncbi:hypothetical protein J6590_005480 [Homalodisca vitripennis]|nr:hypothetical protein J6590_005480 [Homalodisca vitripennis]
MTTNSVLSHGPCQSAHWTISDYGKCGERGSPKHGRMRVILQRPAGIMAGYSCEPDYLRVGSVYSFCIQGTWTTPLPKCVRRPSSAGAREVNDEADQNPGVLVSLEELPSTQRSEIVERTIKSKQVRKKKKRKRKGNKKRKNSLTGARSVATVSKNWDMSCLLNSSTEDPKYVRPPQVPNSMGPKFVRRKTEKQKYLIAIYRCIPGYKLHSPRSRILGCQNEKWVGRLPICLPRKKKYGCINAGCEHDCREVNGKPQCFCFKGFNQNGKSCIDKNECSKNNGGCQNTCHNTPGSFYCSCETGYRLADDRTTCVDINECLLRNGHGPCQGQCDNVEGGYQCSCEGVPGTRLAEDNTSCEDIDECSDQGHLLGCSHSCINTLGSAFCLCPTGYQLDSDWKTCKDINECEEQNHLCETNCINTPGSFHCGQGCGDGYHSVQGTCEDVDECATNATQCSHGCTNTLGSYTCSCLPGFMLDSDDRTCIDIDECLEYADSYLCSHVCENTIGSYKCVCPGDHELSNDHRTCHPKEDECQKKSCSQDCIFENGEAICTCDEGYVLENGTTCVDIDECEQGISGCYHNCINEEGSYICSCPSGLSLLSDRKTCVEKNKHSCPKGYEMIDSNCEDVNECTKNPCSQICENNIGSYECHCNTGFYISEDQTTCVDIDECDQENDCAVGLCINNEGSYSCKCFPGYNTNNVTGKCEDIDECSFTVDEESTICSHSCVNSLGSFHCECPIGFVLGGDSRTCEDIDECLENNEINSRCSHDCINDIGSYHCGCPPGHILKEDNHLCFEVQMCDLNNGGCSHICIQDGGYSFCECPEHFTLSSDNVTCLALHCSENNGGCSQVCNQTTGLCSCHRGFTLESNSKQCIDTNECLYDNGHCSQQCVNTEGSYHCVCDPGYEMDIVSQNCNDINECTKNTSVCDQLCVNSEGSFSCGCFKGYVLADDKISCSDVNECLEESKCSQLCMNTEGSFKCGCKQGFSLSSDMKSCEDIDECFLNMSDCNQICKNSEGGYSCECRKGFKLINESYCIEDLKDTIKQEGCEHGYKVLGDSNNTCCCKSGFVLFNESQCVRVEDCITTDGCSVSTLGLHLCHSSEQSSYETKNVTSRGCKPFSQNERTLKTDCESTTELYPEGTRCHISCRAGYVLVGSNTRVCLDNGSWSGQTTHCQAQIRPYINCPTPLRVNLPLGQNSTFVKIIKPRSNMDWDKHISSVPGWGKQLQALLQFGTTTVQFTASSPTSPYIARCNVSVYVRDAEKPQIKYCPDDIEVIQLPHQKKTPVTWVEPLITDNVHVAHVFQSEKPGVFLRKGSHFINYIAADSSGNIASCQFTITVTGANEIENEP